MTSNLIASLLLTLYLLPCAWQDWHNHRVSNWLTVPAFIVAWPLAIWFGNLEWTMAVYLGCYIAWQRKDMGAADGKLATMTAAICPEVLLIFAGIAIGLFVILRTTHSPTFSIPAITLLFTGAVVISFHIICSRIGWQGLQ